MFKAHVDVVAEPDKWVFETGAKAPTDPMRKRKRHADTEFIVVVKYGAL